MWPNGKPPSDKWGAWQQRRDMTEDDKQRRMHAIVCIEKVLTEDRDLGALSRSRLERALAMLTDDDELQRVKDTARINHERRQMLHGKAGR